MECTVHIIYAYDGLQELRRCVFKKNNPDEERRKAERKQEDLNRQFEEMVINRMRQYFR